MFCEIKTSFQTENNSYSRKDLKYSFMNFPKSDEKSIGNKVVQRNIMQIYKLLFRHTTDRVKLTKVFTEREHFKV